MGFQWVDKAAQKVTLTNCDREQIRTPGSIMADGFLLVCKPVSGQLIAYSEDLRDVIEWDAPRPHAVQELFTVEEFRQIGLWCAATADTLNLESFRKRFGTRWFDITAHSNGAEWIIEGIISEEEDPVSAALDAQTVFDSMFGLDKCETAVHAAQLTAGTVQRITEYDRVMVYKFDSQWNGAVIAESCAPGVEARFLDMHFPHTDIPAQARQLYRVNKTRCISDINKITATLMTVDTGEVCFVDLAFAHLRAISPIHIRYLQNMEVAATQTVSILVNDALWGLIACHHHRCGKRPSLVRRKQCVVLSAMLGNAVARIESVGSGERASQFNGFASRLRSYSVHQGSLPEVLGQVSRVLMDIFKADGLRICLDDDVYEKGYQISERTLRRVHRFCRDDILVHDCTADLLGCDEGQAVSEGGLLLIRFDLGCNEYLLLSRKPQERSVAWAGDPGKRPEAASQSLQENLEPRASFELWKQRVIGRSAPFERSDVDYAIAVKTALLDTIHKFRGSGGQVAKSQLIDLLTELPSRLGFLAELAKLVESIGDDEAVDVLVIDIQDYDRLSFELGMTNADLVVLWFSQSLAELPGVRLLGRVADEKFAIASLASETMVDDLLEQIRRAADGPYMMQDEVVYFTTAIGHATLPDPFDGLDAEKSLEHALEAAYLAARGNRGVTVRYGPKVARYSEEARQMRDQLRLAVGEQGLGHRFQLIWDARSGQFVGAEALVRWTNPAGEEVQAENMIDKLREIDLLEQADFANISRSLRRIGELPEGSKFFVAFNLGGGLADGRNEKDLDALLELPFRHASKVAFIIHQGDIFQHPRGTLAVARKIVKAGAQLFLGGFGSGEAGLGIMAEYPISGVFLSRRVVAAYEQERIVELLAAQNEIAQAMRIQIICPGVESAKQAGVLGRHGLHVQLGDHYSAAVPWSELLTTTAFLKNRL